VRDFAQRRRRADATHAGDPGAPAGFESFDAKESVEAGSKLLKDLLSRYGGDLSLALSAYNAGTAAVDRTRAVPEIPETQNYVSDILTRLLQ
jgi:soluble lytic murein transglycosylase-like protein